MFSSLREKLLNVQEEITSSLRNLKIDRHGLHGLGRQQQNSRRVRGIGDGDPGPNFEAGIELLERYQKYWADIHRKTEATAHAASEADVLVCKLHKTYDEEWAKVGQLTMALAHIPKVLHGVREISDRILNIQCAFDETEEALLTLENLIETQELRERELDHRFQLALYQEKRSNELEDLKVKLTEEHLAKLSEYEKKKLPLMKERQAAFQEAFQEDMQHYKEGNLASAVVRVAGNTSTSSTAVSTPTLEEIELEEDPFVLEEFLAGENEENIEEEAVAAISAATAAASNLTTSISG